MTDKDKWTVVEVVAKALLLLAMAIAATSCSAQDWRKLEYQGVSYVAMPRADLDTIYALRIGKNVVARNCAWSLIQRDREVEALRRAIAGKDTAAKHSAALVSAQAEELRECFEKRGKAKRRAKRRNPITLLCIGAIGGFILNNQLR